MKIFLQFGLIVYQQEKIARTEVGYKGMEEKLERISIEQFKNIMKTLDTSMDDYLYIYDLKNDYYCISKNAVVRFLLPGTEFHNVNENLSKVILPQDMPAVIEDIQLIMEGKKEFHDIQYRWLDQEHRSIWINCRGRVTYDDQGQPEYLIGCINEVGKKQMADNVSGLLGESSLKRDLVGHDGRMDGFMLRLGIDRFKEINENRGMDYGDMVLRKTAECIASVILPEQKLYRIVADEFAVVDFSGRGQEEAVRLYESIRQKINAFIVENEYEVFYTVSAGIMEFKSVVNHTYYNLMKLSEFSLNEAKERGKNKYYLYTREDYHAFTRRKELIRLMRNAINNNFAGFNAHFQPVMDIKQNKLIGAETLMRFYCEEKGNVAPYEFVPLLEESGLMIPVGRWILYRALEACKEIQKVIPGFRVSVNVSYVQVLRSNILEDILEGIKKYELAPSSLLVELTESGFLEENANFIRFCDGLKESGIPLALDDFGTGYSNFHYLSHLTPHTIKIDRSFTLKALKSDYEFGLLQHMADMTHSIDSKFCIEGIETEDELNKICQMGPDYIQGYYFGRPCPYENFMADYVGVA